MTQNNLQPIKQEIVFFMDKTFQFSFVYVAAIFAGIAGTKKEVLDAVAFKLHTTPVLIITSSILTLNLVYLVLATSCGFAVLKRGYFILKHGDRSSDEVLISWEEFARKSIEPFEGFRWNVDNYFVAVIYLFVFLASFASFLWGLLNYSGFFGATFLIVLFLAHLLPVWSLRQTAKLHTICRKEIKGLNDALRPGD